MRMSKLIPCTVALVAVSLLAGTTVVTDVYAAAFDDRDAELSADSGSEPGKGKLDEPAELEQLADDAGGVVKDFPAEASKPQVRPRFRGSDDNVENYRGRSGFGGTRRGAVGRGGRGLTGGRGGDDDHDGFGGRGPAIRHTDSDGEREDLERRMRSEMSRLTGAGRDRHQQHLRPRRVARTVYEMVMEPVPAEQVKAEQELHRALQAFKAGKADRNAVETRVQEQLQVQFDHDLKRREEQLKEVEERVTKLRQQLDRRREAANDIIRLRVQTLLNEASGLGFPGFETPGLARTDESRAYGPFEPQQAASEDHFLDLPESD